MHCQVSNLRARGQDFLSISKTYYINLRERLKSSPVKVAEDLDTVSEHVFGVTCKKMF
ncbi:hypothetical protein DPMN_006232 [Dreissena polymorpha]|uniref:Uncharacterized protein n=1 Tax=Dreissena polymorpha TaxID=45954 RepID=A0A9D4RXA7_DREPO|nr:hypothetical protein DPMN_006232 [Dreissena polymorpha]